MSNARKRHRNTSLGSVLKTLATAFLVVIGLSWLYRVICGAPPGPSRIVADEPSSGKAEESSGYEAGEPSSHGTDAGGYSQELRSYVYGFAFALILTGLAFGMVHWSVFPQFWLFCAIGALALLQMIVHFRFFLHIGFSEQKREDLQLILFSTLLLILMVGGTLWVLYNLSSRM